MLRAKGYRALIRACAAAAAVVVTGSAARAADPAPVVSDGFLQSIGGDGLKDSGIIFRGYVEGGAVFSFDRPASGAMGYGNLFNDKTDDPTLNQVSVLIQRDVTTKTDHFAVGFIVQGIYGSDARFTQANGSNFYGSRNASDISGKSLPAIQASSLSLGSIHLSIGGFGNPQAGFPLANAGQLEPENQGDVLQAAVSLGMPIGGGLVIEGGKFVTPWGMETVDPTLNSLYSHSYTFALSQPKTLTGVLARYRLNDVWEIGGGVVVGWDQSIKDNNDFPSFVVQGLYHYDPDLDFLLSAIVGPEQPDNKNDFRWLLDLTSRYRFSSTVNFGFEALLGWEPNVGSDYVPNTLSGLGTPNATIASALGPNGRDALWYSGAVYGTCKLDEDSILTLVGRLEYFSDTDGARALATEIFSATAGVNITPFPRERWGKQLMIRPEFRWDLSHNIDNFDDNRRATQISVGADVIYAF
jgi:hypothetical protein